VRLLIGEHGTPTLGGVLVELAMATARARIDRGGRLLVPARLRRELGVGPGDAVVLEIKEGELHVRPYKKAIEEAQAIIRKYIPDRDRSLVDELIEERRREAERE
jgi:AbrB family looped-hinge helix DNA binding protein